MHKNHPHRNESHDDLSIINALKSLNLSQKVNVLNEINNLKKQNKEVISTPADLTKDDFPELRTEEVSNKNFNKA